MRSFALFLAPLALATLLSSCGRDPPDSAGGGESGLLIDPAGFDLYEGQTFTFDVLAITEAGLTSVIGSNGLSISVEQESIATVKNDGTGVANKAGSTVMVASHDGLTGQATINVRAGKLTKLEVTPSELLLDVGSTAQLKVEAILDDGSRIDVTRGNTGTTYVAGGPQVGVSADGLVTAAQRGSTTIAIAHGGLTQMVSVAVASDETYVQLLVDPAEATLGFDNRLRLTAIAVRRDGSQVVLDPDMMMVSFQSSAPSIAVVNRRGFVTAQRVSGEATITVTFEGLTATSKIRVGGEISVVGLRIEPAFILMRAGETTFVRILADYSDGSVQDVTFDFNTTVTIFDTFIAFYQGGGSIFGNAGGVTDMSASYMGVVARATIEVVGIPNEIVSIELIAPTQINLGATVGFQVLGFFTDGSIVDLTFDFSLRVFADDASILNVGSGSLTGLREGRTILNASYFSGAGVLFDAQEIQVGTNIDPVIALFFSPSQISMQAGTVANAQLFAVFASGNMADVTFDPGVTYASFGPINHSLGATGLSIRALADGFAEVDASYQGFFAILPINIGGGAMLSNILVIAPATMVSGDVAGYQVIAVFTDGSQQDVTFDPATSVSVTRPRVLSVQPGLITALRPGSSEILATYMGFTGAATVRVTMAFDPVVGLSWQPSSIMMNVGDRPTANVIAQFQSGASAVVTNDPGLFLSPIGPVFTAITPGGVEINAFGTGMAEVDAFYQGFFAPLPITIGGGMIIGIQIVAPTSISVGSFNGFQVFAILSDGSFIDVTFDPTLSISVSDPSVLSAGLGSVTGLRMGRAELIAFYQGFQASQLIEVIDASSIVAIFWQPTSLTMDVGDVQSATLFALTSSGNLIDISGDASTMISATGPVVVLGVGPGGVQIEGLMPGGTGQVNAFYMGFSSALPVSVGMTAMLVGVTVSPMNVMIDVGDTQQLTVTAHFSDGSSQVVTGATMAGNDPSIATVDSTGLVTGVSAGSTSIIVIFGGFSSVVTVTVASAMMPMISAINPDTFFTGSPDTTITITGSGFSRGDTVMIAGIPVTTRVVSPTEIVAVVPAFLLFFPGELDVFVTGVNGMSNVLTISVGDPPVIDSYSPQSVLQGDSIVVTIVGSGLLDLTFASGDLTATLLETAPDGTWARVRVSAAAGVMPGPRTITVSNDFGMASMVITVVDGTMLMDLLVLGGQTVMLSGTNSYHNVTVQTGGRIIGGGTSALAIIASGTIIIRGTIDLGGETGEVGFTDPAAGGDAGPGGAGGGAGGDGDAMTPASGGAGAPPGEASVPGFGAGTPGGFGGGEGGGGGAAFQCGAGGGGGGLGGDGGSGGGDFGPGSGGFQGFGGGRGSSFGAGTGGGGGTTCGNNSGGGGGGGGGGLVLQVATGGTITIDGEIRANGGAGGQGFNGTGGGGGGSGGRIEIIAPGGVIDVNDTISVMGGNGGDTDFGDGGGGGGGGIIVLDASPGGTVNAALGFLALDPGNGGLSRGGGAEGGSGTAGQFQITP